MSEILGERIARQALVPRSRRSVAEAVTVAGPIQAQDAAASRLGVRARAAGIDEQGVLAAIADRRVVRTWLLRGTVHLVAAADVRWLVRLLGPAIIRKSRTRWNGLGLTEEVLARSLDLLPRVLASGPLPRAEIAAALAERGLVVDSDDPQVTTHLLVHASARGLVCRATDRGRDATFVLLDEWLPGSSAGPSGDDALAELARRYFGAFSPATSADFTAWSGLPASRAVELIRGELTPAVTGGRPAWRLGEVPARRGIVLLPAFDNYLLAHRDREPLLDASGRRHVYVGGIIRPTVVADGRVVATWSLRRNGDAAAVTIRPLTTLGRPALRGVEREVADIGRFLGRQAQLAAVEPW